jgi:hypothetical protein
MAMFRIEESSLVIFRMAKMVIKKRAAGFSIA